MSVGVYIGGLPAERFEAYREVLGKLWTIPDGSQNRFDLWATQPLTRATSRSVWLNPPVESPQEEWLRMA